MMSFANRTPLITLTVALSITGMGIGGTDGEFSASFVVVVRPPVSPVGAPIQPNAPLPRNESPRSSDFRKTGNRTTLDSHGGGSSLVCVRRLHVDLHAGEMSPSKRIEYCAEYTKPKSLKIRLLGTPQNHRSPPA